MKREILFKAKIKTNIENEKNGEWIYGSYCRMVIGGNERHMIHVFGDASYRVEHKTLCQFTGLTDKNGVKIFEGDIDSDGFVFEYDFKMGSMYRVKNGEGVQWHSCCVKNRNKLPFEIIGNIHDK